MFVYLFVAVHHHFVFYLTDYLLNHLLLFVVLFFQVDSAVFAPIAVVLIDFVQVTLGIVDFALTIALGIFQLPVFLEGQFAFHSISISSRITSYIFNYYR